MLSVVKIIFIWKPIKLIQSGASYGLMIEKLQNFQLNKRMAQEMVGSKLNSKNQRYCSKRGIESNQITIWIWHLRYIIR